MGDQRSLAELRADFSRSPLLAMPIAGVIAWTASLICGLYLPDKQAAIAMFICMPTVFPLGMLIARYTGEDLFGTKTDNPLDTLFGQAILMANLVWAIAIPFWMVMPASLPLSVGVLGGLMWIPLSWILQHWVALFHAIARTLLVLFAWFLFPRERFVVIPAVVVLIYLISIVALMRRTRPPALVSAS